MLIASSEFFRVDRREEMCECPHFPPFMLNKLKISAHLIETNARK